MKNNYSYRIKYKRNGIVKEVRLWRKDIIFLYNEKILFKLFKLIKIINKFKILKL